MPHYAPLLYCSDSANVSHISCLTALLPKPCNDLQVACIDRQLQQPQSTDGFLNLLLLADSSLDDTEQPPEQQDAGNDCDTADVSAQSANSSSTYDNNSQRQVPQQSAQSVDEHQTVAGNVGLYNWQM